MLDVTFWKKDHFPVVYEGGEAKAVMVDVESFAQVELVLENLLNRDLESEDAIFASSDILKRLVADAQDLPPVADWEAALNEL